MDQHNYIEDIWKDFFETKEEYFRNLLMEHYLPLVKYTADRIYAKVPDKVDLDDLICAGIFALMDAIGIFDTDKGVKFETFCIPRIRGAILDELRSMDWIPRLVRSRAHQLENALKRLEALLGRMPTEEEIANELELEMHEFRRLQRDANANIIEDQKSQNPFIEIQKRDLKGLLTKGFTRAERLIIILYYYEEMTMKEIGATIDLSESRVSQMHSSVIARLKAQMSKRKKDFKIESRLADSLLSQKKTLDQSHLFSLLYSKHIQRPERWNLSDRIKTVMHLANQKAQEQKSEYIDTEHILLGLIDEGSGVAMKALDLLNIDINKLCSKTEGLLKDGLVMISGTLPQTPCAERAIEFAMIESWTLKHDHVGTEHILLGLLKETQGIASLILESFGLNLKGVRRAISLLNNFPGENRLAI